MSDTAIYWDVANGRGDWVLVGNQLATGDDLATSVLISLFTDRTADPDDPLPAATQPDDPRGWWGDLGADKPIGSKFWLLERAKLTQATANSAVDYAKEALQWLVDDGVAASVDATAQIVEPDELILTPVITQPDGKTRSFPFKWAWDARAKAS